VSLQVGDGLPIVRLDEVSVPLRAEELFGAPLPLEVELGSGKGGFLLAWAAANPGAGFLGIERAHKYLAMGAARAARAGLANVRFAHTSGEDLLFRCLAPGSVRRVHVYFPDPWPKKRHHKRRFFSAANVARLADVLEEGGALLAKTDHGGYADVIAALLAAEPRLVEAPAEEAFAALPPSNYETKYAREARAIHRFARRRA